MFDNSWSHSCTPIVSIFQSTDLRLILHRSIKLPELALTTLWEDRAVAGRLCGAEKAFYSLVSASPRRGISWRQNQECLHVSFSSHLIKYYTSARTYSSTLKSAVIQGPAPRLHYKLSVRVVPARGRGWQTLDKKLNQKVESS